MRLLKHFIHGKEVVAASGETFSNLNPATQEQICDVSLALGPEVQQAVDSATQGFRVWSQMTGAERGRVLTKAATILRQRNQEIAAIEVADTGKPISESLNDDVISGADALEYFGGLAAGLKGDHYTLGTNFAYVRREPLGVVLGIGAWNYPIQIACWKSAPALAAGNAMIFKPSEMTPSTANVLAEVFKEAGLPDGVFNVLHGDRRTGELLVAHHGIKKVSLTGEVSTGKKVMSAAAQTLKHVTFELGGKSPLIIFEDADMDSAVAAAMFANFYTQGEICSNGTRVFVHKSIKDAFLKKLVPITQSLVVGDPMNPKTEVGALISKEHLEKVQSYIDQGQKEGALLLCGGEFPSELKGTAMEKGNFVRPVVFDNCLDEYKIVQEEIFGPVMSVLSFEKEDEVVARANGTAMGLAAGVFTKDVSRAHRVVAALEAGTCWINTYNITPIEMPFGGYKQSGLGRENSEWAFQYYTQLKSVYVETGNIPNPYLK